MKMSKAKEEAKHLFLPQTIKGGKLVKKMI